MPKNKPPSKQIGRVASKPQTYLVVHTGGLGDIVLSSSLFSAIKQQFPASRIILLTKAAFGGIAQLFPHPPDEVISLPFDPAQEVVPNDAVRAKLTVLVQLLKKLKADTLIAAEFEPTWLSWFLGAALALSKAVVCSRIGPPRGLLPILISEMGYEPAEFTGPVHDAQLHENDRYRRLAEFLNCRVERVEPWVRPAPPAALLGRLGVTASQYVVCVPLGSSGTVVKRWGPERYGAVLKDVFAAGTTVVLVGEKSERQELEAFSKLLPSKPDQICIFTGTASELPELAGLIAHAESYLSNDTGPAHLAQAYGVPGVIVFGGGTWPYYAPWGEGTIGVVRPLGCFGCGWHCVFSKAYCLDVLPVSAVQVGFTTARHNPRAAAGVMQVEPPEQHTTEMLRQAMTSYLAVQTDRLSRFQASLELERQVNVQAATISKLTQLNTQVRQEADKRMTGLVELTQLIADRDSQIRL